MKRETLIEFLDNNPEVTDILCEFASLAMQHNTSKGDIATFALSDTRSIDYSMPTGFYDDMAQWQVNPFPYVMDYRNQSFGKPLNLYEGVIEKLFDAFKNAELSGKYESVSKRSNMKELRAKVDMFNKLLDLLVEASKRPYFKKQSLLFNEGKTSELGYVAEVIPRRYNKVCDEIENDVKRHSWAELEASDIWQEVSHFKQIEMREERISDYENI